MRDVSPAERALAETRSASESAARAVEAARAAQEALEVAIGRIRLAVDAASVAVGDARAAAASLRSEAQAGVIGLGLAVSRSARAVREAERAVASIAALYRAMPSSRGVAWTPSDAERAADAMASTVEAAEKILSSAIAP
jgi:flagellar biosynthesis regulator FlaF